METINIICQVIEGIVLALLFYKTERKTHSSLLRGWDVSDHLTLIEDILTNSIR